jgi:uncharacterized protein YpmB
MRRRRRRAQDGFIREILWWVIIIVVIAVVVLDGIAIFAANQSVKDDARRAARAAASEYAQSLDTTAAKLAAEQALIGANEKLADFQVARAADGSAVFTVTATAHADTRAFRLLQYVGLKKWVNSVVNTSATRSSN